MNRLKTGLEVSHKDGRRGKIIAIGDRKVRITWDNEGFGTSWERFQDISIIHLAVGDTGRSELLEIAQKEPNVWLIVGMVVGELSRSRIIDDESIAKIHRYFRELTLQKD